MSHLSHIESKVYTNLSALREQIEHWKKAGDKIAFTNGCFDILHKGHVSYLASGAEFGTRLIIGVNSDASVKRQNKSPHRPLQEESGRMLVLASMSFVDAVILFDQDTPLELITALNPDVLFKGADYKVEDIVGAKEVLESGGTVETIALIPGYSTTSVEQKILNQK